MSIPAWARVGAKVVAIHNVGFVVNDNGTRRILKGEIHEIDGVDNDPEYGVLLHLVGFPPLTWHEIVLFRPLVTRTAEQDIAEHFAHHLRRDVPARERA